MQPTPSTKLRSIKVEVITSPTIAGLGTAVNAWIANNAELRTFVQIDFAFDPGSVATPGVAFITYAE